VAETPAPAAWRGIDELAALVGAYCWMEQRVFTVTGVWASRPVHGAAARPDAPAELRVWCAATSRRHGALAARWAERLPVRAGLDSGRLIAPPSRPLAACLDELAGETDLRRGVAALAGGLLPALAAIYDTHLRSASPVSEGPVLEVLAGAHREVAAEARGGGTLIGGFRPGGDGPEGSVTIRQIFERLLNESGVFPAVRPS
jgi:hypothetical protein